MVDVVVEPVGVEKVGGAPPLGLDREGWVVVRKVVFRYVDIQALADVAAVFVGKGVAVVFEVASHED